MVIIIYICIYIYTYIYIYIYIFFFFGHAMWHVASQFPHHGLNRCPLQWKRSPFFPLIYYYYYYYFFFLAVLGLRCCVQAFSSCGERGATLSCGAQPPHCGGFSCCGAQALGARASVVVVHGLMSCGSRALERRLSSCGTRAQLLRGM